MVNKVEPNGSFFCGSFEGAKLSKKNNPVVMAKGIHLFPSRTQQLSPYTSKVLGWTRPGRIDSCRLKKQNPYQKVWVLFFYMI